MSEKEPIIRLPVQPESLPTVDPVVLNAVLIEQKKSTSTMCKTLRGYGWGAMQAAYIEDHWAWAQIARAIVHERQKRGESMVSLEALETIRAQQPDVIQARAEAAWTAEHGELEPPRPPAAEATKQRIQLPKRPTRRT